MEPQGGDLFRIEIETEVVTDIADDSHQAVARPFEPFAVVGFQQEPARRLRQMFAACDPVAGVADAGVKVQPDHRVRSDQRWVQIGAVEMLNAVVG